MDYREVEGNLRESFRVLAAGRPRADVREIGGISIASLGVTFQMFNAAFLSAPVRSEPDLEQRIAVAGVHFAARGLEWAYWVCEGFFEPKIARRSRQVFRKRDLRLSVELPGMVAECIAPPVRQLPTLEVRRVGDPATRSAFAAIGSVCFNVPISWFQEVFNHQAVWDRFAGFVGYADGEAVATAATVPGAGVIGVYNVATLPAYQRRGYGEAVTRYALEEAQREHGITRTILQATPQGYNIYERMGYRTVTSISVYAS